MADNTENIGGVSVSITGDFSELGADFDAAVALAVSKGATLAEAIQSSMRVPDTTPLTNAFSTIGDAATQAAGQLSLFDQAAHVNYSDATGQLNLFATELEKMGPSASEAAAGVMKLPVALGEAGDKAHETESIFMEFGEKVSEILEHPVQQFRALIEAMGPVAIGVLAIGAAFYEAGKQIAELVLEEGKAARETQNLADKLNLTFEETKQLGEMASVVGVNVDVLSRASMRLAVALDDTSPAGEKVRDALQRMGVEAGDSGEALKQLLEKLAAIPDATQRIAMATEVMGRGAVQLQPLLNNYEALKQAVEDLGGKLDTEGVQKLLEANKAANLLAIAWDHLKESLAAAFAPAVTEAMKLLTALLTDPKPMTLDDQIKSLTQEIKDLKIAADGAKNSVDSFFGRSTGTAGAGEPDQELIKEREATLKLLETEKEGIDLEAKWTATTNKHLNDLIKGYADATLGAEAYAKALYAAYAQLGVTNFSSLTTPTVDDKGNVTKLSDTGAFDALATTLEGPRLAQAADNLEKKLLEAFHAGAMSADEFNERVAHVEEALDKARDSGQLFGEVVKAAFEPTTGLTNLDGSLQKVSTALDVAQAHLAKFKDLNLQLQMGLDGTGLALLQATTGIDSFDVGLSKAASEAGALGGLMLSTSEEMPKFYAPLIKAEKEWAASEIADGQAVLKAMHIRQSESLEETLANNKIIQESDRYSAQVKLESQHKTNVALLADAQLFRKEYEDNLKTEIALAAERGQDATAFIIALTQEQYQTKALADAATNLGEVYKSLRADFDSAFGQLSKGLADAIVNSKSLGDMFENVGKKIATSILDTIIAGALKPLQDELNKTGGLFDTLAKQATSAVSHIPGFGGAKLGGSIPGAGSGEVASEGSSLPGGSPGDFGGEAGTADTVGSSGVTSSGGSGAAGALGSVTSIAGAIGSVASAISSIVGNFQMSHMNKLLGEMEVTTRQIANVVALNGGETIFAFSKITSQLAQVMVDELAQIHSDLVEIMFTTGSGGGTSGGAGGIDAFQIVDLVEGLKSGRLQNYTAPVGNPLYPGGQPSLDTSAANDALDALATKATAAGTTLADFGTATIAAQTAAADGAAITATLTTAQQAQLGLVKESMSAYLSEAHALLEAGDAAKLTSLQLFALGRESASLGTSETQLELAQRQVVDTMAAAQATWNWGRPQVAGVPGSVPQPGFLAGDTIFPSSVESGAAFGTSTGTLQYGGGFNYDFSSGSSINDFGGDTSLLGAFTSKFGAQANEILHKARARGLTDTEAMFFDGSSLDYNALSVYYGQHQLHQTAGNQASPNPSYMIPSTPTNSYNAGSATVSVTAVNPTSRSVADGIITGLRQVGVKI